MSLLRGILLVCDVLVLVRMWGLQLVPSVLRLAAVVLMQLWVELLASALEKLVWMLLRVFGGGPWLGAGVAFGSLRSVAAVWLGYPGGHVAVLGIGRRAMDCAAVARRKAR